MTTLARGFALNKQHFNPALYARIRSLWFSDLPPGATSANQASLKKWYAGGSPSETAAFDALCGSACKGALQTIGPSRYPLPLRRGNTHALETADAALIAAPFVRELEEARSSSSEVEQAETALSLILLLDQMPRNIFRKAQLAIYGHYDPMARSLLRHILASSSRLYQHPHFRASPVHRLWFYMPLMHSEFLEDHVLYGELSQEAKMECEKRGDAEAAKYVDRCIKFETSHREIVERFGRYPYRNEVMKRQSTDEERTWLANGGETFGTS